MEENVIPLDEFLDSYIITNDIDREKFLSPNRSREIVDARMIYCAVARKEGGYTLKHIGETLNRDHATALHAIKNYKILSTVDKKIKADFNKGVTLYRQLAYRPKWTNAGLIDTLFESNQRLRQIIHTKEGMIMAFKQKIADMKIELNKL
tara:strand:- start:1560 stop:2009 length:450 start_codon:yes stop_codon:yes gene_type:complete